MFSEEVFFSEAAVFDEAMKEREDKIEEMHALMQQSAERAKSMEQNYQEQLVECGEENRSLQDKIEYLHQEMKERETKLLQEIREMNEHSTQKIDNLDSDLEKMQTLYDTLQNESRETIQNLNAQAEQRDLQVHCFMNALELDVLDVYSWLMSKQRRVK